MTGNCICPPNVQGAKCEECKPATYGYDALVGCTVSLYLAQLLKANNIDP